eukprot:5786814-Amphidinium_carterae.1
MTCQASASVARDTVEQCLRPSIVCLLKMRGTVSLMRTLQYLAEIPGGFVLFAIGQVVVSLTQLHVEISHT